MPIAQGAPHVQRVQAVHMHPTQKRLFVPVVQFLLRFMQPNIALAQQATTSCWKKTNVLAANSRLVLQMLYTRPVLLAQRVT